MRRTIIIIPALAIAIALCASAAPAAASETAAAAATQNAAPRARADAGQDPNRRICVNEQMSSSRIPRRICRTAREWAEEEREAAPVLPIR